VGESGLGKRQISRAWMGRGRRDAIWPLLWPCTWASGMYVHTGTRAGGRITLARAVVGGRGGRGASACPMRDPQALGPTLQLVAWPDGDQDHGVHTPGSPPTLGSKQTGRPLPPAAVGRARIARPGLVTSVPRLVLKYALQARRASLSLQSPSSKHARCLAALLYTSPFGLLSYPPPFCQPHPRCCRALPRCKFRLRNPKLISCMHAVDHSDCAHATLVYTTSTTTTTTTI
jgi:hypothetical protein